MPIKTGRCTALFPACLNLMVHLARLPVPEAHIPGAITGADKLPVRRDLEVDTISGIVVPTETLFAVLTEFICRAVHNDLVIAGLESDVFPVWMGCSAREREHVWFRDEFDRDGDAVFPGAEGLIVGGGDEAAVLVDEGEGVDCGKVVVVFLDEFAGAGVELDDLFVGHTSNELVAEVCAGVKADDVGCFARGEARDALACFGVPEFHLAIVGSR